MTARELIDYLGRLAPETPVLVEAAEAEDCYLNARLVTILVVPRERERGAFWDGDFQSATRPWQKPEDAPADALTVAVLERRFED